MKKTVLMLISTMVVLGSHAVGCTGPDTVADSGYISSGDKLKDMAYNLATISAYRFQVGPSQDGFPPPVPNSMDCLKAIPYNYGYIGLFHQAMQGGYFRTILVKNDSNDFINGSWKYVNVMEPNSDCRGMGYIYMYGDGFFTGGEFASKYGNYIIVKWFDSFNSLIANQCQSCWGLNNNRVLTPFGHDAWNVGTPDIENVFDNGSMDIRFHFTRSDARSEDAPGFGNVTLKSGNHGAYENWSGYFDSSANNAIRTAEITIASDKQKYPPQGNITVPGKIGCRDYFDYNGKRYYIYEAQLSPKMDDSNEAWASWSLFLYCPDIDNTRAVQIPLSVNGVIDFANPRITQITGVTIGITLFIPSQGTSDPKQPGEFLCTVTLPY